MFFNLVHITSSNHSIEFIAFYVTQNLQSNLNIHIHKNVSNTKTTHFVLRMKVMNLDIQSYYIKT